MTIKKNIFFSILLGFAILLPATSSFSQDYNYVILPGDILHISVWREETMNQEVIVLPDGTITFPLVGTMNARDMTPQDLQSKIRKKLKPFIPDAPVTVSVKAPMGHKVSIIGQVREPGEIILDKRMGVIQALSQVGGLTPYAEDDEIIILRTNAEGEQETIEFPYHRISRGRDLDKNIDLLPGDVIVVPTSGLF